MKKRFFLFFCMMLLLNFSPCAFGADAPPSGEAFQAGYGDTFYTVPYGLTFGMSPDEVHARLKKVDAEHGIKLKNWKKNDERGSLNLEITAYTVFMAIKDEESKVEFASAEFYFIDNRLFEFGFQYHSPVDKNLLETIRAEAGKLYGTSKPHEKNPRIIRFEEGKGDVALATYPIKGTDTAVAAYFWSKSLDAEVEARKAKLAKEVSGLGQGVDMLTGVWAVDDAITKANLPASHAKYKNNLYGLIGNNPEMAFDVRQGKFKPYGPATVFNQTVFERKGNSVTITNSKLRPASLQMESDTAFRIEAFGEKGVFLYYKKISSDPKEYYKSNVFLSNSF